MARGDDRDKLSDIWAAILHLRRNFSSQMYSRLLDRSEAGERKGGDGSGSDQYLGAIPLVPWYVEHGPGDIECTMQLLITGWLNPQDGSDGPGDIPATLELLSTPFHKDFTFYMTVEHKQVTITIDGVMILNKEDFEGDILQLTFKYQEIDIEEELFKITHTYVGANYDKSYILSFILEATPYETTIIPIQTKLLRSLFDQYIFSLQFDYTRGSYSNTLPITTKLDPIPYDQDLFDMNSTLYRIPFTTTLFSDIRADIELEPFTDNTLPITTEIKPIYIDHSFIVDVILQGTYIDPIDIPTLMSVEYQLYPDDKIYGVKFANWDMYSKTFDSSYATTNGIRTYDAVGFSFTRSTTSTQGQDTFKERNVGPFRIRKCLSRYDENFKQQVIVAYDTDDNWSSIINDPEYADYNRMIELPFFYYRRNSTYEFDVSQIQYDEFIPSPMHYRNGVMHNYVYISQYLLDSNFSSRSGTVPFTGTLDAFRSGAKSKGFFLGDYPLYMSLTILMLIKYANLDITSVIGKPDQSLQAVLTGLTDNIRGIDGSTSLNSLSEGRTLTFGIEDLFSNMNKLIDGIFSLDSKVFINEDIASINVSPTSRFKGYSSVRSTLPESTSGSVEKLMYDIQYPYLLLPDSFNDSHNINSYFSKHQNPTSVGSLVFGTGDTDSQLPTGMYFSSGKQGVSLGWILSEDTREANGVVRQGIDCSMIVRTNVEHISDTKIYGIDFSNSTNGLRTDDAVGLAFTRSTTTSQGTDDFVSYNAGPFMVRECISEYDSSSGKQVVILSEEDEGYEDIKNDERYNRVIEIPAFFYKRTSPYKIQVSCTQYDGFLPSPMHYRNGVMYEKVYISKYSLDSNGMSKPNASISLAQLSTHRSRVKYQGLSILDYPSYCSLTLLMLVKYANLDVQSVIGNGLSVIYSDSGTTSDILTKDGEAPDGSILTLGLENWYSKSWQILDGIILDNGSILYMDEDIESVSSNLQQNSLSSYSYIPLKVPPTYSAVPYYISDLSYNDIYPYSLIPESVTNETPLIQDLYENYSTAFNRFNPVLVNGFDSNNLDTGLLSLKLNGLLTSSYIARSIFFSEETIDGIKNPIFKTIECEMEVPDPRIYGVRFTNYTNALLSDNSTIDSNTTIGIRTQDSSSFTFTRSTTTSQGTDDFVSYNAGPFMVRECISEYDSSSGKQVIVGYEGSIEFDLHKNDNNYNRMIEFPLFYYNRPSRYEFEVSSAQHEGFIPSPLHWRNGQLYSKVYISKYPLNKLGRSRGTGAYNANMSTLRTLSRSQGMYLLDWSGLNTLWILMLIKYANLDISSIIGSGICVSTTDIDNTQVEQILSKDGAMSTNDNVSISTLGIANLWGNLAYFIDGITRSENSIYINEDIADIVYDLDQNKIGASKVLTDIYTREDGYAGYIKELAYDPDFSYCLHPTNVGSPNINSKLADMDVADLLDYSILIYGGNKQSSISTNRFADSPAPFFMKFAKSTSKAYALGMFLGGVVTENLTQRQYDYEISAKLLVPVADSDIIEDYNIYGIDFIAYYTALENGGELSLIGKRIRDSSSFTFTRSTTTSQGTDDFVSYNAGPFMVRECISEYDSSSGKQVVLMYEDNEEWNNYKDDPSYNHFIEFPAFFYRRVTPYRFEVKAMQEEGDGFLPSPMHYRNGVMYEKVYISKYALDSEYMSRSNKLPLTNNTIDTFRSQVLSKGMYLIDWPVVCSIAILMFIKYGSLDVSSVIGKGVTNTNGPVISGATSSVLSKDGSISNDISANGSIVTLGLENWWGNVYYVLDGLLIDNELIGRINESIESIQTNPDQTELAGYSAIGEPFLNTTAKNISRFAYDISYPYSLHASEVSIERGTNNYYGFSNGNPSVPWFGGYWGSSMANALSLFCQKGMGVKSNQLGCASFFLSDQIREGVSGAANTVINCSMIVRTKVTHVSDLRIYGVEFNDYADMINGDTDIVNTSGIRTDDSSSFTFTRSTTTSQGTDDFVSYNAGPFMVRECISEYDSSSGKQVVILSEEDEGYEDIKNDERYNRVIEIPAFFYKRTSPYKIQVSCTQYDGFLPSPMHYRNGVMYEKVYISKYALDSEYMSRSGASPKVSTTLDEFRQGVTNLGMHIVDLPLSMTLTLLMLIKYANLDVQSVIGNGKTSGNRPVDNGDGDNILSHDGTNGTSIVTLGLENWWGNVWYMLDRTVHTDSHLYINEDIDSSSTAILDCSIINTKIADATGMIRDLAFDDIYQYSLHAAGISSKQTLGDRLITSLDTELHLALIGGSIQDGASFCGALSMDVSHPLDYSSQYVSSTAFFLSDETIEGAKIRFLYEIECELFILDPSVSEDDDRAIYGVSFDENTLEGTRTDSCATWNFEKSTASLQGTDDFVSYNAGPFMVRECISEYDSSSGKQVVLMYEDNEEWNNYKDDPSYNHFIEFPMFYYKRSSRFEFKVSQIQYDGFLPSPMHYRNGVMYEKVYISKYALDSEYMSRSNKLPLTNNTIDTFRSQVLSKGMYLIDWPVVCSIAILMFIKYGSLDVSSVIGKGISLNSTIQYTGNSTDILSHDGTNGISIVTLGLENWWGNVWYYVDGLYKKGEYLYINEDIGAINENPSFIDSDYVKIPTKVATSIDKSKGITLAYDNTFPYSLHPVYDSETTLASIEEWAKSGILEAITETEFQYKPFPLNLFLSQDAGLDSFPRTGAMAFCILDETEREGFNAKVSKVIDCSMVVKSTTEIIRQDAIYGIDFSNSTNGLRTDDAVGLAFTRSTTTSQGTDDFVSYNAGPFMVRECISEYDSSSGKQVIVGYDTDEDYQDLLASEKYNVMIEFPAFFYRRINRYKFQISTTNHDGFLPSPMHYRNGVMYEKVYISKYALDSEYMSRSNKLPLTNNTIDTFRSQVLSKGMYLIDWPVVCSIAILMFIKYGSLDVQSVIGLGLQQDLENVVITPNGSSDLILSYDGSTSASPRNSGAVKTLGLENWWGNVWYYVDGLYKKGEYLYINEDILHITSNPDITNNNSYLKIPTPTTLGNQTEVKVPAFDALYPYSLHPVEIITGKKIETMSDYNWQNSSARESMSESGWIYGKYSAAVLLSNTVITSQDHTAARSFFLSDLIIDEEITIDRSFDIDCNMTVVDPDLEIAGSDYRKYGINFINYASNPINSNTQGRRTEWAQSYGFRRGTLINTGIDSFIEDEAGPYMIRECVTLYDPIAKTHKVIGYKGDANWNDIKDRAVYNRMIEFPLFYYNRPSRYEFVVSSSKYKGYKPSPMHYRNGVMYEKVYVSKYAINGNFMSQSNSTILTNTTLRNFRTGVRNQGMYLIDWPVVCSIAILMFIKYGSLDVQSVIGLGHASMRNNRKVKTGVADNILSNDGSISNDISANGSIVTLGLENWWGNVWYYVDGLYKKGEYLYINEDIENITSNPRTTSWTGYTPMATLLPTMDGGIQQIAFDAQFPYSLHPSLVEDNDNMGDYFWYGPDDSSVYQAIFGGSYYDDTYCGPIYLNLFTELGLSDESLGAVAFFLKDPVQQG